MIILREHLISPLGVGNLLVLCVCGFVLFDLVLCLVYPVLTMFVDCAFLIAPSGLL